jgi:hypothetical protein
VLEGQEYGFEELCARTADKQCVIRNGFLRQDAFQQLMANKQVTFPMFLPDGHRMPMDLSDTIAGVKVDETGRLVAARVLKFRSEPRLILIRRAG